MPTDKSFRKVQGLSSTPATKGAEYQVKVSRVTPMPAGPKSQARSPKPQHLGATRGVGAGGARVPAMKSSKHTRAMGIEST